MSFVFDSRAANRLYKKLSLSIPLPSTELIYRNHFELLIAVMLTAQATDKIVNEVTPPLFEKYPSPKNFVLCGEKKLSQLIKRIGLAPTKAKNIIRTCQILIETHNGIIPQTREDLVELPGVGRKTANVVLNEAFGIPTIAVDTHVFRVSNRTGLAKGKTVLEIEKKLIEVTPNKWKKDAHHYLLLHGRYVCKSKNFNCSTCSIKKECQFENKII
ncbi:MAG: endonuclease III [Nitrospina sp.]|mgnify:FL=1|jgi:endonuclease-3|nr:endonuclease III [Nitrospina sp.]MBT7271703.1 endonuclease III [Nitrospina sp.]MBT7521494.1 endonuclease III [Nitrospina sp.]